MKTRNFLTLSTFLVLLLFSSANAHSNWQRSSAKRIDQKFMNDSTTATFNPTSINSVAAQSVISKSNIISTGKWNNDNQYSIQASGQEFILKLHSDPADNLPSTVSLSFTTPASKQTKVRSKNLLSGKFTESGDMIAESGNSASSVQLIHQEQFSVFSPSN